MKIVTWRAQLIERYPNPKRIRGRELRCEQGQLFKRRILLPFDASHQLIFIVQRVDKSQIMRDGLR